MTGTFYACAPPESQTPGIPIEPSIRSGEALALSGKVHNPPGFLGSLTRDSHFWLAQAPFLLSDERKKEGKKKETSLRNEFGWMVLSLFSRTLKHFQPQLQGMEVVKPYGSASLACGVSAGLCW